MNSSARTTLLFLTLLPFATTELIDPVYEITTIRGLTRDSYRSILDLGEVITEIPIEQQDTQYFTERTSKKEGVFIVTESGNVISGVFYHTFITSDGEKLQARSEISRNFDGTHLRHIKRNFNIADVEIEMESDEMFKYEQDIDTSWWHSVQRRSLQTGNKIYTVQFYYTTGAEAYDSRGVDFLKDQVLLSVGESNLAYANTGLPITQVWIGPLVRWESSVTNWKTHWANELTPEEYNQADILGLITDDRETSESCGIAYTIPGMYSGGYYASQAFFVIRASCFTNYVVTHEIGHLMGLGHNAHTTHCEAPYTGCGNVIRCGDNGYRTVMSYQSSLMWEYSATQNGFPCTNDESGYETRLGVFSGPNVRYVLSTGEAVITGSIAANARDRILIGIEHIASYTDDLSSAPTQVQPSRVPTTPFPSQMPIPTTRSPSQSPIICNGQIHIVRIVILTWGSEISWILGSSNNWLCRSPNAGAYTDYATHEMECCLQQGFYTLYCIDSYGDGWHGAYIEVGPNRYCEDFVDGYSKMQQVWVADAVYPTSSPVAYPSRSPTLAPGECSGHEVLVTHVAKGYAYENSWEIGTCKHDGPFRDNSRTVTRCCFYPGEYTINCIDSYGDGWHGAYLVLEDEIGFGTIEVCKNFLTGYVFTETMIVEKGQPSILPATSLPETTSLATTTSPITECELENQIKAHSSGEARVISMLLATFSRQTFEIRFRSHFIYLGKACVPFHGVDIAGRIALVERGDCYFDEKFEIVLLAGASAMIVFNSQGSSGIVAMGSSGSQPSWVYENSAIAMMISRNEGLALINQAGTTMLEFVCENWPTPDPTQVPTQAPSTSAPSLSPTHEPTSKPTWNPSCTPTMNPSLTPSFIPSIIPSHSQPSSTPLTSKPTPVPDGPCSAYNFQNFESFSGIYRLSEFTEYENPTFVHESGDMELYLSSTQIWTINTLDGYFAIRNDYSDVPDSGVWFGSSAASRWIFFPNVIATCIGWMTWRPTKSPVAKPSYSPSNLPSCFPSLAPIDPTLDPSHKPSPLPTKHPTQNPSGCPSTSNPSVTPSASPTASPSEIPSYVPSITPSFFPSMFPSHIPSSAPTTVPSAPPSFVPTKSPSVLPSNLPSISKPSCSPSRSPTNIPSNSPSFGPTLSPSFDPTTAYPSAIPSPIPSSTPTNGPSIRPTRPPSLNPSPLPSRHPSESPSFNPSSFPTICPFVAPSSNPSTAPSQIPTTSPSTKPTKYPSLQPTPLPTSEPSDFPSSDPSTIPSQKPTISPSGNPTEHPSIQPTFHPMTSAPSHYPTKLPSSAPTRKPSLCPSSSPSRIPTSSTPSSAPSFNPSPAPSQIPTISPSATPSKYPSFQPTTLPTTQPSTHIPSSLPTQYPSFCPITSAPSHYPTKLPSSSPTRKPSLWPSNYPSRIPTSSIPSSAPSPDPSPKPSQIPTTSPTTTPTKCPSFQPTMLPTIKPSTHIPSSLPTQYPTPLPSALPSINPSFFPSTSPSVMPTQMPTILPSNKPSNYPSLHPTLFPTTQPSSNPSAFPSPTPSHMPTTSPSAKPTKYPSLQPTPLPTAQPSTHVPSSLPTQHPTPLPSDTPSFNPSPFPTASPSVVPSRNPTISPSTKPSKYPSVQPTSLPSTQPSSIPSVIPTSIPSEMPTISPSNKPTIYPSLQPTSLPSTQPSPCVPIQLCTHCRCEHQRGLHIEHTRDVNSISECAEFALRRGHRYFTSRAPDNRCDIFTRDENEQCSEENIIHGQNKNWILFYIPTCMAHIPSSLPTQYPTTLPSASPSFNPSLFPTISPSTRPTKYPSPQPTPLPTTEPSSAPSSFPSRTPSQLPTISPSTRPTKYPSLQPTPLPTTEPSSAPSSFPSQTPSQLPTISPPSNRPSLQPTPLPTTEPSSTPSSFPSRTPSQLPTTAPSTRPTKYPSFQPTPLPTTEPSSAPSSFPSQTPSEKPTISPSAKPSKYPSLQPTPLPRTQPSSAPSPFPSRTPSQMPTISPSTTPTKYPSLQPTTLPTTEPSNAPSAFPSQIPSKKPTIPPSTKPTKHPSLQPTRLPTTNAPSHYPSRKPSLYPSTFPSLPPSKQPTTLPSINPSNQPSQSPTSISPTNLPSSIYPSSFPSSSPTLSAPTFDPNASPTLTPTKLPLPSNPSIYPTAPPTFDPTANPTLIPTKPPRISGPSIYPIALYPPKPHPSISPSPIPFVNVPSRPPVSPSLQQLLFLPSLVPLLYISPVPSPLPSLTPAHKMSQTPTENPTPTARKPTASKLPNCHFSVTSAFVPCTTTTTVAVHPNPPTIIPSYEPTPVPDIMFTDEPTVMPTLFPSMEPSLLPSLAPTKEPSRRPTFNPSLTPTSTPTFNPSFEPTEEPSIAPSADPTQSGSADPTQSTDGWCVNDIPSDIPRRFPGSTADCVSDLNGGTRDWLVSGVSSRMEARGLMNEDEELCIIQHGVDDYEWAVVHDGFIYPTCVQSGSVTKPTTSMVPNSEDGSSTNLNKQANQLEFEGVFGRRNYMAYSCPPVQSYCSVDKINSWWIGEVESVISSLGVAVEDDWSSNICIGEDGAVRVITQTEILNTCSGYVYESGMTDEDVRNSYCEGYNTWECGTKIFSPFENPGPGYPVNQFRQIARAITQDDYTLPECSFNNNNYCQVESMEQREQPRYSDLSNCVDASHPQYDPSLPSVLDRIRAKDTTGSTYDLCYMADEDDDLQYVLFVDGVGYPTCVSAPTSSAEDCPTDKFWCVESERSNWPNTVANRLKEGKVFGADGEVPRANHMHWLCPTIQDICLPGGPLASTNGGLKNFELAELEPPEMAGQFDNNLCVGTNGGIRVVTSDGIQPTCTSYIYNTELMGSGNEQREVCPSERNFMCGSLQEVTGEKTVGWMTAQHEVVRTALRQSDYLHPHCPYLECREC